MEIKKLEYSARPWRLITTDGFEVRMPVDFEHEDRSISQLMCISGNTKKECERVAFAVLERLLLGHTVEITCRK